MNYFDKYTCLGFLGAALLGGVAGAAEVTVFEEGFETAGNGSRYIIEGEGDNGQLAFFGRRQLNSTGVEASGGTARGDWIFGISDLDGLPQNRVADFPHLGVREGQILINDLDVSGVGNLRFEMAVAVGEGTHEADNEMVVSVRFDDGDWVDLGGFRSSSSNTPPKYFAGPGNTVTMADWPGLLSYFTDWGWNIVGNGQSLDIRIFVDSNYYEEDYFLDNLRVIRDDAVALMSASFANAEPAEPESGAVANPLTIELGQPAPAGGVEITVESTREGANSLRLPASLRIPAGNTKATFATEVVQDGGFTGTEINDYVFAAPGYNNAMARLTIANSTPEPTRLVIMEIHAATPGNQPEDLEGDANNDGRRHSSDDQFIEIVNFESYPVDLTGWTIGEEIGDRHMFPEGTVLQPKQAIVVFGGGKPSGAFGGAIIQTSSSGGNGLGFDRASGPDSAYLKAPFDVRVEEHLMWQLADYQEETSKLPEDNPAYDEGGSQARLEPGRDAEWVMHPLTPSAGYALFSPGTWPDGTPYFEAENKLSVSISADVVAERAGEPIIATASLQKPAGPGGMEVRIDTTGVVVSSDGGFAPDEIDLDAISFRIPAGGSEAEFAIYPHDDGVLDGDRRVDLVLRAGAYVLPASTSFTVTDVADPSVVDGVYISEVMVDIEGSYVDINLDGVHEDPAGDQFIEILNRSGQTLNLSGWTMSWNDGSVFSVPYHVHRFPANTLVPDQGSIVVFGWITEEKRSDPSFGKAIVQGALNAEGSRQFVGLDLPIGRDVELSLFNRHGYEVDLVIFESDWGEQNQSITIDEEGVMALHLDYSMDFSAFSPGLDHLTIEPYPGNGASVSLLLSVFPDATSPHGGGWYWDPGFGWLYSGAPVWDIPFVYADAAGGYWYVLTPATADGFWAYDYALDSWIYTAGDLFPWAWVDREQAWKTRN